jgi:FMN reductase
MTHPRIVGIAGSFRRPSKTRSLVETIGAEIGRTRPVDFVVHDLVEIGPGLGGAFSRTQLAPDAARVLRDIETADALIVGTPVFKGSYTGLFKHLFDLVEPDALRDVPVIDGTLVDAAVRERASTAAAQLSAVLGQRVEQTRSREPVRLAAVR